MEGDGTTCGRHRGQGRVEQVRREDLKHENSLMSSSMVMFYHLVVVRRVSDRLL